jgi:DNA/RNA endonuclease YhcR with UshA esterase domain
MRKTFTVVAIFLAVALAPRAEDTNTAQKIPAAEASKHYNETLIVNGKVAEVTVRPKVVYLNLDKPYPDSPCTGVIFARNKGRFGDLQSLKGQDVEIKGTIKEYRGKPEIILDDTNQLTVVGQK